MTAQLRTYLNEHHSVPALTNLALCCGAMLLAFLLRFELTLPADVVHMLWRVLPLAVITKGLVFHLRGLHRGSRRFASVSDVQPIFLTNILASALLVITIVAVIGPEFPRSVMLLDFFLCTAMIAVSHYSERVCREGMRNQRRTTARRILIYGAGQAGTVLARETVVNRALDIQAAGFIDDDPKKTGTRINGVAVLGRGRDVAIIVDALKKRGVVVEEIVIAMPSATGPQMREALANCRQAGLPCKTVPSTRDLLDKSSHGSPVRSLRLEDLLGRKPVRLEEAPIRSSIAGCTVMVTGAAGSIGSELCRQLARFGPKCLILFDQAETPLFQIHSELLKSFPDLEMNVMLGDMCDEQDISACFESFHVDSVYHAAAYKHVPMLERCVAGGVRNNIVGTYNLITAAKHYGVSRFVMISTDKAVNPTNIMGASKRACELIVLAVAATAPRMRSATVRFGNVLGSNGSVVPIFQQQIAAGGPVKITHPEIRRFFMTIPEAVSLVLQASIMSEGSEVFVLDMGEPIKILDLAINMIRLAGLEPSEDIDIQVTGLRPGEKIYEEVCAHDELVRPTFHEKIKIFRQPGQDLARIEAWVQHLKALVASRKQPELIAHLLDLVPEYRPDPRLDVHPSKPPARATAPRLSKSVTA